MSNLSELFRQEKTASGYRQKLVSHLKKYYYNPEFEFFDCMREELLRSSQSFVQYQQEISGLSQEQLVNFKYQMTYSKIFQSVMTAI